MTTKYFDSMGKDVTAYVEGLERELRELKGQLEPAASATATEVKFMETETEESEKPKTRRKKHADTP
jgi:hypothetical protein